MPATDNRVSPLASLQLYDIGQGDPYFTDKGTWRYCVHEYQAAYGTFGRDANQVPYLRLLPGVGLVCREYLVRKDTRTADWTTSGGSWEERQMGVGSPRVYFLHQYSSAADVAWSATSRYLLPDNPSFACQLYLFETPADHDATTYPVYARVEFGGVWAVSFNRDRGTRLMKKVGDNWLEWQDLPEPSQGFAADMKAYTVFVRCDAGKVGISLDFGKSYTQVANADGTDIVVAPATVVVRGQGMAAGFGLHQVRFYEGTYTSPGMKTFTARNPATSTPTLATVGAYTPTGASITLADMAAADTSGGTTQTAKYRATITPSSARASGAIAPWETYRSPVLPGVYLTYATARSSPSSAVTTPWNGDVLTIDVDKPYELDQATCTVHIRRNADVDFSGDYRFRKVNVILGHVLVNDTIEWWTVFVGYIRSITPSQDAYNRASLAVVLDNRSIRAKDDGAKWNKQRGLPLLGNRTVNAALDVCLDYLGLQAADRSWHYLGNRVVLPLGNPIQPTEWAREGETVWDTMTRIVEYAGLELGVTDAGLFSTVLKDYVSPTVDVTWEANPASDANAAVQQAENTLNYSNSYTAVFVTGENAAGWEASAYLCDTVAETDPTSGRFCPWPRVFQARVPGTVTPQILGMAVGAHARERIPLKTEPKLEGRAALGVTRRQRARYTGGNIGMGDSTDYAILTVHHHYEASSARQATTVGLRKVV